MSVLGAALAAAARGISTLPIWPVVPGPTGALVCACGLADCKSPGKHPIGHLTPQGLGNASSDPVVIRRWFEAYPTASAAIALARSGLIAFDIDLYKGDGAKLQALEQRYGDLPHLTPAQMSGSGQGLHLIVAAPPYPIRGEIGGVTMRARNYIVLAPSVHVSGGRYAWIAGRSFDEVAPATLPDAWLEALRRPMTEGTAGVPAPEDEPPWLACVSLEQRLADARAHLEREYGERKGADPAGTAFNVARSTVRGYALREPDRALALILEVYNPKCSPPYDAHEIARRVVAAYDDAIAPAWGDFYEPHDHRQRRRLADMFGMSPAPAGSPAVAAASAPQTEARTVVEVHAYLKTAAGKLARGSGEKRRDAEYLRRALAGAPLVEVGEDPELVIAQTVEAAAKAAPAGATARQLVDLLIASASLAGVEASDLETAAAVALDKAQTDAVEAEARKAARKAARAEGDAPADDTALAARLMPGLNGEGVRPCGSNIELILRWSADTRGHLRYDTLTNAIIVTGGRFAEEHPNGLSVAIKNWLEERWGIYVATHAVEEQLLRGARAWGAFDPVGDYLGALEWDGVPRLEEWLLRYCQVADTVYARRVGAMWMVSAVARALDPGAKVDTVLVLEGSQGAMKSTALSVLGGAWFSDTPLVIGDKDSRMMTSTRWIIELAELASLRGRDAESLKAFLSAREDDFRPPYGRVLEKTRRRCVFAGTTNLDEYLVDTTGARRFWSVRVGQIAIEALRSDRDQLWAEAVAYYRAGMRWWFTADEQAELADPVAADRRAEDVWSSTILSWWSQTLAEARRAGPFTLSEIAKMALQIDVADIKRHDRAVASALREAGFTYKRAPNTGSNAPRPRLWYPPSLAPGAP